MAESSSTFKTGPSMSLIDSKGAGSSSGAGIGNYKGVMLCNRPFGGTAGTNNMSSNSSSKPQFAAGKVPEALGVPVHSTAREKFLSMKKKKDSVLSKHKKWLQDLQKTKERLEAEYLEEQQRKEESLKRFQEGERKLREAALSSIRAEQKNEGGIAPETDDDRVKATLENARREAAEQGSSIAPSKGAGGKGGAGAKGNARPVWAMSEKQTEEKGLENGDELDQDELDLLNFANSIDFDKVINDIEVQTMLEKLQQRVLDLEKDILVDEQRATDAKSSKREMLALLGAAMTSLAKQEARAAEDRDESALAAARKLLEDDEDLQAVHSTKSVAMMVRNAQDKKGKEKDKGNEGKEVFESKAMFEVTLFININ